MFGSDSEKEDNEIDEFMPAVLRRPKVANHLIHESFTVDTRDHDDHRFCGVMFDIGCRTLKDSSVPFEFLQVDSMSIRGDLGPITVWTTPGSYKGKEHAKEAWEIVYEKEHPPSRREYQCLQLDPPIRIAPGQTCGLYVHSKLAGDDAIVYDNQRQRVTYEDQIFQVLPGLAHLSNRPFGRHGMWGFPWRECREFVGRIAYGVNYTLWNPEVHRLFPRDFQLAAKTMLLCARRMDSPLYWLQDEVVFYILNMCRYDWFSSSLQHQPIGGATAATPARPHQPSFQDSLRGQWTQAQTPDDSDDEDSDGMPDAFMNEED